MRTSDLVSLRGVFAHKSRTLLTLLGIVIGSGSIVLLAGLLRAGEEALVNAGQQAVESDLVQIDGDLVPMNQRHKARRDLSRLDVTALGEAELLSGTLVGAESSLHTEARYRGKKRPARVASANPASLGLYQLTLQKGRPLDEGDLAHRRRVCVVGQEIYQDLGLAEGELGQVSIEAGGQVWTVIGVLANKPLIGNTTSTNIWNRKLLVPETTYDSIYAPDHRADRLYVRKGRSVLPDKALRATVEGVLLRRHLGVRNFKLRKPSNAGQEKLIFDTIKLLLFSTGLFSLFVGGINIMNVMLVTVRERTREIGVRRAVGATPRMIMVQFLIEAAAVSFTGGVIGVVAGVGVTWLAALGLRQLVGKWEFYAEPWAIALGLLLSLFTGIVFGILPARRAAALDPIEALRFE